MVTACYDRGVVHKDVKDENLVVDLDTNRILLIDFGSGGFLVEEDEFKYEGTRVYAPPEWIQPKIQVGLKKDCQLQIFNQG